MATSLRNLISRVPRVSAVRGLSTAAAPTKKQLREVEVPKDKSAISPVRGMFFGDLASSNKNCFPYPQSLSESEKETLRELIDPIEKFMATVPSAKIDEESQIPDEIMDGLRELGLFGLQIPEDLGGLGLSNTAYGRIAEILNMDPSIAVTLMAHQSIGLKGILLFGTPEQKEKYLPKLATGEDIAAFVLTEPTVGSDAAGIKTTAKLAEDGKTWLISGTKLWISNGGIAKVFTVFARTETPDGQSKMTAFIVDRDFGGITSGAPEKKLGIRGSNTVQLNFDNCPVPAENVLGEVHGGFKVAMGILNNGRFGMGAATGGGIRRLIGLAAEYANQRVQFGAPISNYGLIQEKFARMACDAYAIESMSYMTTALIDKGELDMSVEAAICKIYGSEAIFRAVNDCIQILGGMGFASGGAYPFERLMRDSRILLIFEGTNEILRLFIALTCLRAPGAELGKMAKNPMGNAADLAKLELLSRLDIPGFGPKLENVASELSTEADGFSNAVAKFRGAVYTLLKRHGKDLPNHQMQVARLADAAIHLYGWMSVLSRATQAKGSNVEDLATEIEMAKLWIKNAEKTIDDALDGIRAGEEESGDAAAVRVAKATLGAGKYLAQHPINV